MKTAAALTLALLFFRSAAGLSCQSSFPVTSGDCPSAGNRCATIAVRTSMFHPEVGMESKSTHRMCVPAALCGNTLKVLGPPMATYVALVKCCAGDNCNVGDVPYPERLTEKNGKRCYSLLDCMGNQDRCMNVTYNNRDSTSKFVGCVPSQTCTGLQSANLELHKWMEGVTLTCGGNNLCVPLAVVLLCLITFIVY